jgi:hypothetical protein
VHKLFVGLIRRTARLKTQANSIKELRAMTERAFQETFQQRKKRWEWCIASKGDYFEGDSV